MFHVRIYNNPRKYYVYQSGRRVIESPDVDDALEKLAVLAPDLEPELPVEKEEKK